MRKIGQILRFLIPVIVALGVLVVFLTAAATRIEQNKALVMRYAEEVWNKGDMAVADEIVASNYTRYNVGGTPKGTIRGREALKQYIMTVRTAFPDWHVTARDVIAQGDKVVVRWALRGTFKGEWKVPAGVIPPNGEKCAFEDLMIYHIAGGKVVKECEFCQDLYAAYQMGMKLVPGDWLPPYPHFLR
jgi:predicted ester cyclase